MRLNSKELMEIDVHRNFNITHRIDQINLVHQYKLTAGTSTLTEKADAEATRMAAIASFMVD